ncbi:3260_t:CDS:10 [Funneliformis geosporum]|uniref:3260_t:CDS:1 n=1 Tax=Funneliformis geosporum TaxID=1117311 RepID=A0A9W4WYA0_9GLOM|nr:3260_t:CDS:10 [Funneliformis geosporum]
MSKTENIHISAIPSNEVNIRLVENSAYETSLLANNEKDQKGTRRQLVIIDKPNTPKDIVLHAIIGGLRSYVMAHGIRGGVNFLLNLLTVFRKRKGSIYKIYKAFIRGFFGTDAVRFGVAFGGFSFLWKFINNGLRYVRKEDDHWNGLAAGSIAGISIMAEKRERRISIAQQLFVRALQALYNAGHARDYFRIPHGDALLFIISTAQMRPTTIPKDFLNFMIITARVPKKTLDINLHLRRGLSLDKEVAIDLVKSFKGTKNAIEVAYNLPPRPVTIPCELVHPKFDSCIYTIIERFYQVFRRIAPVYATLNFVPMVAFKLKQLAKEPMGLIQKSSFNTIRSSTFLATFVASYQSHICLHRNIVKYFDITWDSKYLYWWAGFSSALAIFIEHKNRRADLALYVLPKAAESWYKIMCQKNWIFELHRTAEVWFFSAAMGIIMTAYQHEPETLSPMAKLWLQILYIFLGVSIAFFLTITTYLFYHRRKQIKDMETRSMRLSITFAISNIIFCPVLVIYNGFYKDTFPCYVILWNIYLSVVIYLAVIFIRGLRLIFLAQLSYAMLEATWGTKPTLMLEQNNEENRLNKNFTVKEHLKWYRKQKKYSTDKVLCYGLFFVVGIVVIALMGMTIFIDEFSIKNTKKDCAFILYYFLRTIEESYGLRRDFLKNICIFIFSLVLYILWITVFQTADSIWRPLMWLPTALVSSHVITILIPIIRSYDKNDDSKDECREQERMMRFSQVLGDDDLFEQYKICTASFFCAELMLFIEEYQFLKKTVLRYYYKSQTHELIEIDNPLLNDNAATCQNSTFWEVSDPEPSLTDEMMPRDVQLSAGIEKNVSPVTVSIHDNLVKCLSKPPPANEKIPKILRPYFFRFFRIFLVPSADLAVNVIDSTIRDVTAKINTEDYRLDMFETAKAEVLHLLYGNTFATFVEKYKENIQSILQPKIEDVI